MTTKFFIFNYPINNILTPASISIALKYLYMKELANIDPKVKICIMFKVKTEDNEWIIISPLQVLDAKDWGKLEEIFVNFWSTKLEIYKELTVKDIVFRYILLENNTVNGIISYPTDLEQQGLFMDYLSILPRNRLPDS